MKIFKRKSAMAIPIVLAFATIMAAVSAFLINTTKNNNKQIQTNYAQLQSYFIARAGVEHAMVKVKYLNRELYDAVCLSQGRNPLFNYSMVNNVNNPGAAISQFNPGPIFMYKAADAGRYPRNGLISNRLPSKSKRWVNCFKADIKSDFGSPNATININGLGSNVRGGYIRNASYLLSNIDVLASKVNEISAARIENNIMVEFTIRSTLNTVKGESYDYTIKRTARIDRN